MRIGGWMSSMQVIGSTRQIERDAARFRRMEELNTCPTLHAELLVQASEAEAVRRNHISQEVSIRALGNLYLFAGILVVFLIALALTGGIRAPSTVMLWQWGPVLILIGVASIVVGIGLRMLQGWASIAAIVLCIMLGVFNLMALPGSKVVALVLPGGIILTLLSAKSRWVVSRDYKRIIAETPHLKPRTSIAAWLLIALLMIIVAALLVRVSITQ
jgi:hypothetical protein